MVSSKRLTRTGECWFESGSKSAIGPFFTPGPDKTAESTVVSVEHDGVPEFLHFQGCGSSAQNTRPEVAKW